MMNNFRTFSTVLAALLLASCGVAGNQGGNSSGNEAQPMTYTSLTGLKIGGQFSLSDQDGKIRSWDDFAGSYRLVYFGYSFCPDVCPLDLQQIMQGYAAFAKADPVRAAKVQPIFITLDPERDTPTVVKTYVAAFSPKLIGLTGSSQQIEAVAKSFAVAFSKEEEATKGQYIVAHSRTPYLFGPDGAPIALVPVDDPTTPKQEGKAPEVTAFLDAMVR